MRLAAVLVLLAACATAPGSEAVSARGPAAQPRPASTSATSAPRDFTDGTSPCDHLQIAVTESGYVLIADRREAPVSIDRAVERLAACKDVLALPKICAPPDHRSCRYRETPIWWTVTEGDEPRNQRRSARVDALWKRVQAAGLAMPAPSYLLERAHERLTIYGSRAALGASAALVPEDFDFRTRAIARAYFPGGAWQRRCLDEDLGRTPDDARSAQQAEEEREHRLRHGKAARFEAAALSYQRGALIISTPDPGPPPRTDGRCRMSPLPVPVLVPIPRTRVTVVQR